MILIRFLRVTAYVRSGAACRHPQEPRKPGRSLPQRPEQPRSRDVLADCGIRLLTGTTLMAFEGADARLAPVVRTRDAIAATAGEPG